MKKKCTRSIVNGVLAWSLLFLLPRVNALVTTTGEIRGTVLDPSSAAVPGAELKLVDQAAGTERTTVSSRDGGFVFVRLQPGSYRITATAPGFQTAVSAGVKVETARATDVVVKMIMGSVTETVEVQGAAAALEATSTTVSTTVRNELIQALPLSGRDVLSFALLVTGTQRGSTDRDSTFNGLPNASLNISLDGVNNNSQRFKTGGTSVFVFAPLRLGAVEEVTVSTTGMTADASGTGAMQMRFITRRGSNQFHGSVFEQFRNDVLNANTWFNNASGLRRPTLRLNEFGGNFGGPFWKNKLFFFINHEELRRPGQTVAGNTVLTTDAQQGIFRYNGTDGVQRTANVLQIAGQAGFPSQLDPTVASQLKSMTGAQTYGVVTSQDLIRNTLQFNRHGGVNDVTERYPTARLDYQITPNLSWYGAWNLRWRDIRPSERWPGPGFKPEGRFISTYFIVSMGVGWTIRPTVFNEFRWGVQGNPELGSAFQTFSQFDVNGTLMQIAYPLGIPSLVGTGQPNPRNNPVYDFSDNANVVKGTHTFTFGASVHRTTMWDSSFGAAGIPQFTLGVDSSDPIASALNAANLPAIRSQDLPNAWGLYALLTGRLSNITSNRAVDERTRPTSIHPAQGPYRWTSLGMVVMPMNSL